MCRRRSFPTVHGMQRTRYLERLGSIGALSQCTRRQLRQVASLVDDVELPAGTQLRGPGGELVVTLTPTRALVVDRRALPAVLDVAPTLGTPAPEVPLDSA